MNKDVKPLLEQHDITYFTTASKRKATIVERLNRTIKEKILKMFNYHGDHAWEKYLEMLVHNYNTQNHRSIGMKPDDVNEDNKFTVWGRLFGHVMKIDEPKLKVGDHVRVLHFDTHYQDKAFRDYFKQKYPRKINVTTGKPIREYALSARDKPPFSHEIFTVHEVLLGDPVVYKLYSDEVGVEILGKFYERELSLIRQ